MTATQDTNLTSPESRTSQEGVVENSDPAGGSCRPFGPERAPTPPFPMASRGSSFLPFLVKKLAWDFSVFPDPEFLHCFLLLAHMSQVLFIFQSLLQSPWAAQTPSLVNLPDFWRPFLTYLHQLVLYMLTLLLCNSRVGIKREM